MTKKGDRSANRLVRYLSFGIQLMAAVGLGIWAGHWLDDKINSPIPLLIWILPTVLLVMMLVGLVRTFSRQQKNKDRPGAEGMHD